MENSVREFREPVRRSVIATLLESETMTYGKDKDKTFENLYLEDKHDNAIEIGCATKRFTDEDGEPIYQSGDRLFISYEHRIKGVTCYMDENDTMQVHETTGFSVTSIKKLRTK